MLLVLLYGKRFSEADTAAASIYTKFKERGVNAYLVLSDLMEKGIYGYTYNDFNKGLADVICAKEDKYDVCIMNVPYIYAPTYYNSLEIYDRLNILTSAQFIRNRERVLELLKTKGHDILEYNLVFDEDNSDASGKFKTRDRRDMLRELGAMRKYEAEARDSNSDVLKEICDCFGATQVKSNPINWNRIYEEAVCVLQGWDCYGI